MIILDGNTPPYVTKKKTWRRRATFDINDVRTKTEESLANTSLPYVDSCHVRSAA